MAIVGSGVVWWLGLPVVVLLRYNGQGRKVQNLKRKCNTRTQKRTQYRDQKLAYCAQREQVVFLLSVVLRLLLCLVTPLALMLSIHWFPTVDCTVRLVVGAARFPGKGLLGCCGPYVGPWRLRFCVLLSCRWAVRVLLRVLGRTFVMVK